VKKNKGRRKADTRRKKRLKAAPAAVARTKLPPVSAPQTQPPRSATPPAARRLSIDWPALAILVVPLAIMALLESLMSPPKPIAPPPTAWYGDLSREAMPVFPEPSNHAALAPAEAPLPPWHGKLALEAMPLFPEPTNHVARAPVEPPPAPWHGELVLETMPLFPEPTNHAALVPAEPPPAPWHGDLAIEAMPLFPEPTNAHIAPPAVAALPPPICVAEAPSAAVSVPPSNFGRAIAAAARAQTEDFAIYNARYFHIAYPGGDTQALYGVCTDVVIRAYRALGIDLQELIHTSRLGRGDPSIDHRRVEVVRRFLTRHGTSLAISEFAEDYRPGDIVTYHRPEGRISQYHIAVVTDQIAPSGRPLIVHNRGWGPQVEDALFVDRITGHYRLSREQVEVFQRTRAPRVSDRRRTADVSSTTRR